MRFQPAICVGTDDLLPGPPRSWEAAPDIHAGRPTSEANVLKAPPGDASSPLHHPTPRAGHLWGIPAIFYEILQPRGRQTPRGKRSNPPSNLAHLLTPSSNLPNRTIPITQSAHLHTGYGPAATRGTPPHAEEASPSPSPAGPGPATTSGQARQRARRKSVV